jgi:hypothetical protein
VGHRKVTLSGLEPHPGEQSFAELQSAMGEAVMVAAKARFTTEEAIARELDSIFIIESGQGQVDEIARPIQAMSLLDTETTLTPGQSQAIADKRRRRRQIYQQYAANFSGQSPRECDLLVVRQLMSELLAECSSRRLNEDEIGKVGSILLQGPMAQELKQTQGKEAILTYAMEVLAKAQQVVETAQRRSHDREMGM